MPLNPLRRVGISSAAFASSRTSAAAGFCPSCAGTECHVPARGARGCVIAESVCAGAFVIHQGGSSVSQWGVSSCGCRAGGGTTRDGGCGFGSSIMGLGGLSAGSGSGFGATAARSGGAHCGAARSGAARCAGGAAGAAITAAAAVSASAGISRTELACVASGTMRGLCATVRAAVRPCTRRCRSTSLTEFRKLSSAFLRLTRFSTNPTAAGFRRCRLKAAARSSAHVLIPDSITRIVQSARRAKYSASAETVSGAVSVNIRPSRADGIPSPVCGISAEPRVFRSNSVPIVAGPSFVPGRRSAGTGPAASTSTASRPSTPSISVTRPVIVVTPTPGLVPVNTQLRSWPSFEANSIAVASRSRCSSATSSETSSKSGNCAIGL